MRAAMEQARILTHAPAVRVFHRLHGVRLHRERRGIGFLDAAAQRFGDGVEQAQHFIGVDGFRVRASGQARLVVNRIHQPHGHIAQQHDQRRHGHGTPRHLTPGHAQVLVARGIGRKGDDRRQQHEDQDVGGQENGLEWHRPTRQVQGSGFRVQS
jgi:hypothetical protein